MEHTNEDAGAGSGMRTGAGEAQDAGGTRSGARGCTRSGDGDGKGGDGKGGEGARPDPGASGGRPRLRRWVRRIALTAVVAVLVATVASFTYNAFTSGRARTPAGLSYVQAGDVRTRYETWGTTGSPIVLVHGAFESADTWSRLAPLLARDHRVYALDLTGSGYSQRRGPYTVDHMTSQLLGFLDAMHLGGPGRRPVLVGHSSGAAMVAEAALRAPQRLGGVMFLDGDALDTGGGPPPAVRRALVDYVLLDPFRTSLMRLAVRSDRVFRDFYDSQCGPRCPRLEGVALDAWRRPLEVAGAESAFWTSIAEGVPGLPAATVARLRAIHLPKAVVFGARDGMFSRSAPQQVARRIGAPAPTLIQGARHLTMISDPAAVAAAVRSLAG